MGRRSKGLRFRKYPVTPYQKQALASLQPPEDLTVSEWAERYRVLDAKTSGSPGPWRNDKTPYLVGIMDELCNYETEEVIFVKPTQVGGTETILNSIGRIIQQDPSPTCVGFTKMTSSGSNSPSQLASRPIRNLFLDEVDKYPGASKKESDPISLATERTKTFRNRKIFKTSTPTLKTGHIWKAMEAADQIRHYFVPCPHCGEYIELVWQQVKFPNEDGMTYADRAEFAVYECQNCHGIITDRHKPEMLRHGEWRTVEEKTQFPRKVAFWINTLYSPFVRFSEMVKAFLTSKDDPDLFQNFTNSWLAEPWEDTKLKTNADLVLERQTTLPEFIVPKWARLLTAGIDVQETSIYYTIRAWGNYLTSQNIAHGQVYNFAEIERIMNLQYAREESGEPLVVSLALVDSGDNTDLVYDFCASNADWALPSKGSSHPMDTHFRISKVNKTDSRAYGMQLAIIDTGKYKDMIAGRMRKRNGTGSWMVYRGCDREYAEQVTAEHKVNVKSGQRTIQAWVLKTSHADNHLLDCEVYAMCAADMLGARTFHLEELEMPPRAEAQKEPAPTPEENWIGQNDGWLSEG